MGAEMVGDTDLAMRSKFLEEVLEEDEDMNV